MTQMDALELMYTKRFNISSSSERFHVVDIDPYGTAAPFLDSAI